MKRSVPAHLVGSNIQTCQCHLLSASVSKNGSDSSLDVLSKGLVQQGHFFEVSSQTTFNNVLHSAFGFAFSTSSSFSNTTLIGNGVFWNFITAEVGWAHRSDMDSNIVGSCLSCFSIGINCK